MFSWFRAKAPLATAEKAWTERAMRKLTDRFGLESLAASDFLNPEEYVEHFDGSDAHAHEIFVDVREAMRIPASKLGFEFVDDLLELSGHYEPGVYPVVRIRRSLLEDPTALAATIAHQAAVHLLTAGGGGSEDDPEFEPTAGMLPIFFGYGVFTANAPVPFRAKRYGPTDTWSIGRHGLLPSRIPGYGLALAAAFRNEYRPVWSRALRPDAREPFDVGVRYLETGDSLFHPGTYQPRVPPPRTADIVSSLGHRCATFRYDALVRLAAHVAATGNRPNDDGVAAIVRLVGDRDADVAAAACRALGGCANVGQAARDELQRAIWHKRSVVGAAAIRALGRLGVHNLEFVDSVTRLMADEDVDLATAAADAVADCGRETPELAHHVLRLMRRAVVMGTGELMRAAARALAAVAEDPLEALERFYAGGDPELRMIAVAALHEARQPPEP